MEKIRARHQGRRNIYVHNDLSCAAFHFIEQIKDKLERNDRKGIAYEYMACMVMLAFTFEAKINFLGHKIIPDWKERQPFNDKVNTVFGRLELNPDWASRPYSSVARLKEFRDSIAHGNPVEIEFDEEVVASPQEIDRTIDLEGEWEQHCEHENVFNAYEDIDTIWKELLSLSGLEVYETITHGDSGLIFIEKVIEKAT